MTDTYLSSDEIQSFVAKTSPENQMILMSVGIVASGITSTEDALNKFVQVNSAIVQQLADELDTTEDQTAQSVFDDHLAFVMQLEVLRAALAQEREDAAAATATVPGASFN